MITRKERVWVFWFGVVVMAITSIPYLAALAVEGDTWKFTGFLIGVEDGNSYLAKMLSGAFGSWLFKTPYTTFPQKGTLAFLPYIILGKFASGDGMHAQLMVLFHSFRFIAGILCILATYDFISNFVSNLWARRIGTLLATIGGGFGFLYVAGLGGLWQQRLPLEFFSPETFGFLSLFSLPHLALGRACLLWGLSSVMNGSHPIRKMPLTSLYFLVLVLVQPVTAALADGLVMLVVIGQIIIQYSEVHHLREAFTSVWQEMKIRLVWAAAPALALLLGILISFQGDPFLQRWEAQNIITSPPLVDYLLAYGWTMPFVILAIVFMVRKEIHWQPFLIGWVFVLPILVYMPVNLQRRLAEGGWIALVILVVTVCERIIHGKKVLAWSAALFSLSTIVILAGGLMTALNPSEPVFIPAREAEAFNFLADEAIPGDVVLASYQVSNALPAWVPVRVVSGHGPESIDGNSINSLVKNFFSGKITAEQQNEFLLDYKVKYVYFGSSEIALGRWNPESIRSLMLVYSDGEIDIYKVVAQ
ncbi:MAG TPA: hypothetical protein PLI60_01800 [Anaerolineaceae bacterium]|nr:hypothetical protein [Anaerolineaceae bacterium]